MRNFYKVLGIASTADGRRIKSAFRRRAKAVHPDLNPGSVRAEARFIELMQAYEVLSDAGTRAAYDAYLAAQRAEARRRLRHCAGLMAASFMLTATSALFVMGIAGAKVPYRETWQLAVTALSATDPKARTDAHSSGAGWTAQVAVAPVSEGPAAPNPTEPANGSTAEHGHRAKAEPRPATAPPRAPAARNGQAVPDTSVRGHKQQVAAAPRPAPASTDGPPAAARPAPASLETWWSFPADDEPRYSLGASDIR